MLVFDDDEDEDEDDDDHDNDDDEDDDDDDDDDGDGDERWATRCSSVVPQLSLTPCSQVSEAQTSDWDPCSLHIRVSSYPYFHDVV